jgi:magnesium chelatase family protein
MNPCPCGHLGDPRHACRCPAPLVDRYRARVSGPLLDRIDLHVEVPPVRLRDLAATGGESSATVAARVGAARARQEERLASALRTPYNAAMSADLVARHCRLDAGAQRLLDAAFERLGLSARALHRVLKVARTLADLAGADGIASPHVAEAIQLRSLDRRLGG